MVLFFQEKYLIETFNLWAFEKLTYRVEILKSFDIWYC